MFSNRAAGTAVNFGGMLDNTASTLDVGSKGLFGSGGLGNLSGTIKGGTVLSTDATALTANNYYGAGTLDGVTLGGSSLNVNGYVSIYNDLTLANGLTLNKDNGQWYFRSTGIQNIASPGTATINNNGGAFYAGYGVSGQTLQVGSGVTVQGYGGIYQSNAADLVNNGSIIANTAGQTFTVNTNAFTNNGAVGVAAGAVFSRPGGFISNGTLTGSGTIDMGAGSTLTNNGNIAPGMASGDSTGTLSITGNLVMGAGSSLNVDMNGTLAGDYDKLSVSGTANLGNATLNLSGGSGAGSYAVLGAAGGLGGTTFATINAGTFTQAPSYSTTNLTLGVTANSNASIYWDGGANTAKWEDAANWSNDLVPTSASTLYIGSGAGTVTVSSAGQAANAVTSDGSFTLLPGTLSASSLNLSSSSVFRGTTTISGGTLTGAGAITIASGGILNWSLGTIDGSVTSTTLTTQAGSVSNVTGGVLGGNRTWNNSGTLNIAPAAWTKAGVLNHAAGVLNLTGSFTTAQLFAFNRTAGSTVNLTGVLDNTRNTLDIGSAAFGSGGLTTLTGTIRNGTVLSTDTTPLTGVSATLDGVTLGSSLKVNGDFNILNDLTLANGINVSKDSGTWYFRSTGTQHIAVTAGTSSAGAASINSNGGNFYLGYAVAGQTLQVDSGITMQGYGAFIQSSSANLVNNGSIIASTAGQSLTINPNTFTNNGTVGSVAGNLNLSGVTLANASGGSIAIGSGTTSTVNPTNFSNAGSIAANGSTLSLTPTGTYANSGTLALNSGTLNLGGAFAFSDLGSGHYSRATGTTVNMVSGTLDLGGNTLDIGSAGLFGTGGLSAFSGTIKNGTLVSNDGTVLQNAGGTLESITLGSSSSTSLSTNGGTLNFNNGVTLADGVTVNNGGGAWYFKGTYTGGTVNDQSILTSGAATLQMNGGALYSYNYPPASQTITIGAGVTVKGYGAIADGYYGQSWVNNGSIIASTAGQTMTVNPNTFTNNGTVASSLGNLNLGGVTLTNATGGSIAIGSGTTSTINPTNFSNAGSIAANGSTLSLTPTGTYANSGTLALNSGTLNLGGAFAFSDLGSGHYSRATGTTVNMVSGTLDLGGNTLDIGSAGLFGTGGLSAFSGTIKNGTLVSNDGTVLQNAGGTLESITLGSSSSTSLSTNGGTLNFNNGVTLADGVTVNNGGGAWYFKGTYTGGTVNDQSILTSGAATLQMNGGALYSYNYPPASQTITIGAGVTVKGYGAIADGYYGQSWVNNGSIIASTAGQTMTVNPNTFTNNGTVASSLGNLNLGGVTLTNATGGSIAIGSGTTSTINPTNFSNAGSIAANGSTLSLTPTGTYANSGTLALNSGTLNLGGAFAFSDLGSGHYSRATGTTVNMVSGTLDLGGNTLDIGSAGLFGTGGLSAFSGTIKNGTLVSNDGTVLQNAGGTLESITLGSSSSTSLSTNGGTLNFNNGVTLADGVTVNNGGGAWYFKGTYTGGTVNDQSILTSGAATLQMNGGALYSYNYPPASQTITIGAGVTVKGYGAIADGYYGQSWVNNGSIIASTAGQTMTVNPTTFTNNGTVGVAAGATFNRPAGFTNNGIVSGTGTISVGTGTSGLVNQGSINPGGTGAVGTLAISGDLTFGTGSVLNLELGGVITGQFDTLKVSGAVSGTEGSFGGLTLAKINGFGFFNPNGDSFPLVSAASGLDSGSFPTTSLARNYLTPSYTPNVFSMLAVPYVLTVNPDAVSGVYGAPDPTITYSATGFDTATNDSAASAFSGALSRATGNNVGSYAYTKGTLFSPLGYVVKLGTSTGTSFSITPASLSVTANAAVKNYDGTAYSGGNGVTYAGFVLGDTATALGGTLIYGGTSQGAVNTGNYTITPSGLTANNYRINYFDGTLTINPAQITAVPIAGSLTGSTSKVYDGTTVATLTPANYLLTGWVSTDGATVSKTGGTFDTANAGTGKTVTVSLASSDYVPTGSTALSNYTLPTVVSGAIGTITPAPLSVSAGNVSKVYDGTLTATGAAAVVSSGTLFGTDTLNGGSFAYTDKNAGVGNKTVTVGGVVVNDGNSGANYSVSYVNNATSTITQRPLSTWTASGSGQWSNAGNWDALPDGSNVLAVSIPAGVSVVYDAAVGTTSLQSVTSAGGFSLTGGNLSIAGSLSTPQYNQTGGALSVANAINVNGSFSQSAGTIAAGGPVSIVQNSGDLIVGSIQAPAISLTALAGNIGQTAGLNSTGLLSTQSTGSTVLNDAGNRLASFKAVSSGAGNVELTNVGVLDVQGISTAAGDIVLNNTGGISTSGLVQANAGAVSMTANSPLTIGSSGISANNNITLTATNLTSSGNMTLNGPLTSFAGGITLNAANNYVQNSSLMAALAINVSAGGSMTFGPNAMSTGNPVNYYINGQPLTPPWLVSAPVTGTVGSDFVVSFLSEFQDRLEAMLVDYSYSDPLAQYRTNKSSIVVEGNLCSR